MDIEDGRGSTKETRIHYEVFYTWWGLSKEEETWKLKTMEPRVLLHGVVDTHGVNMIERNWALLEVSPVAAVLEIVS